VGVLWLGEPSCGDPELVGGKAASLSRLAAQYRVPPGFCLPASLCARWAGRAGGGGPSAPAELMDRVGAAYDLLADRCGRPDPPVAVRSSATDEDGATASFAGQYESFLNVAGADAVVEAIVRCWAVATSAHLTSYRQRHGLSEAGVLLPILVQQLVLADVAAVAFSANPVTGQRGEVMIDASWGLGESIVGGSVTPDTYVVRRTDRAILRRSVGAKRRMTLPVACGTREVDVPPPLQGAPALDDGQILEVADLAVSLEAQTGTPVDVECAFECGALYLLQCRPITTL
jgi:phosphoenolpyruvate synthase/pyruvate phosphate dikinase